MFPHRSRLPILFTMLLLAASCRPADPTFPGVIRGAALESETLLLWGDGLYGANSSGVRLRTLSNDHYGTGGCLADADGDGTPDLVLQTAGWLVWLRGPDFRTAQRIDSEADFSDCLAATLLGRRGILVAHRGLQVRFYTPPPSPGERWPYTEIYSFYTASYQSGLLLHDVDGDGHPDILCGNYWIRSPASFDLPWRLFAINTYNDTPEAAHVRLAITQGRLIVAQREMKPAKLALFTPPPDTTELWREQRLDGAFHLDHPAALAASASSFAVGEREGRGRVFWWKSLNEPPLLLGEGAGVVGLFRSLDGKALIAVRTRGLTSYDVSRLQ